EDVGDTGTDAVSFDPEAGPAGTLLFQIHPLTDTAATVAALLNNDATASNYFTAAVSDPADTTSLLNFYVPPATANGKNNTTKATVLDPLTKAPVTIAGITFTERKANLLKKAVTITVKGKVTQSKNFVVTATPDSAGTTVSLLITYSKPLIGSSNLPVAQLLAFLNTDAAASSVTTLFSVSATTSDNLLKLSSFSGTQLTGTVNPIGVSGGNAKFSSQTLAIPGNNNDLVIKAR